MINRWSGIVAALGLVFAGTAAAADSGFYFGLFGGSSDYKFKEPDFLIGSFAPEPTLPVITPSFDFNAEAPAFSVAVPIAVTPIAWFPGDDDHATVWGAIAGYRIVRYAAVELSYLDLGTLEDSQPLYAGLPALNAEVHRELHTSGVTISGLGILPITGAWSVYARLGALFSQMKQSSSITGAGGFSDSISFGSQDLLWGVGTEFAWGSHWSARLDFQRFEEVGDTNGAGQADIDMLTLGILYRL